MAEASTEIKAGLLAFGEDVLLTKFPSYVDGLKDVTRRILWFSKDQRDPRSFLKVMGDIMENHVAGDSSVYNAIIRLGQDFMVANSLIEIHGKGGSYYAPTEAGAPRYLKICISEYGRDIFLNGIHPKTLPMQPTKDFSAMEPRYLIPKLPTALILGNLTVGFGFKSTTPLIAFTDVCDLVMRYSEWFQKKRAGLPTNNLIAKYLIPAFPINNLIRNRDELYQAYLRDEYDVSIKSEGWAEISGNMITLRTVPYGTDFGTVTNGLRKLLQDKKHWLYNHINYANQYSSSDAEFAIEVKRGQNPYLVMDKLRSVLRYQSQWKPLYSYMKDGRALTLPPPLLTYLWYQERSISIAGGLKYKQTELINKKMMLEAMLHIVDNIDDVITIIRNANDEEDAVKQLHTQFDSITHKQAKIIAQQKLSILARANRGSVSKDLEQVENELTSTINKFSHIDETIHNDAEFLKKKYGKPKVTKYASEYKGYVRYGNLGLTHFFTLDEMYDLLNAKGWPNNTPKYVHMFSKKDVVRSLVIGGKVQPTPEEDFSKHVYCEQMLCSPGRPSPYTLGIKPDGSVCVLEGQLKDIADLVTLCPITKNFIAIHRKGGVSTQSVDDITIKKATIRGMKSDIIYGLPEGSTDMVVFHMNTNEPNVIRCDRILCDGFERVHTVATGNVKVIGVIPFNTTEETWLNIPSCVTKSSVVEHVVVGPPNKWMKNNYIAVNINRTSESAVRRHRRARSIVLLHVKEDNFEE